MKCKRCGHEWKNRVLEPVRCPKCQSPYWDRERLNLPKGQLYRMGFKSPEELISPIVGPPIRRASDEISEPSEYQDLKQKIRSVYKGRSLGPSYPSPEVLKAILETRKPYAIPVKGTNEFKAYRQYILEKKVVPTVEELKKYIEEEWQ